GPGVGSAVGVGATAVGVAEEVATVWSIASGVTPGFRMNPQAESVMPQTARAARSARRCRSPGDAEAHLCRHMSLPFLPSPDLTHTIRRP
ncbi:MAG: hypothetical protein ACREQ5_36920, partial [Candidatus Dormibacteria bacterium]